MEALTLTVSISSYPVVRDSFFYSMQLSHLKLVRHNHYKYLSSEGFYHETLYENNLSKMPMGKI